MGLMHCVYVSEATAPISPPVLQQILAVSRERNAAAGVTGMLICSPQAFFQVLEGEAADVESVYARIARDPRHHQLRRLVSEPIAQRGFADWAMGEAQVSEAEIQALTGSSDLMSATAALSQLGDAQARSLLTAFLRGRWRARLRGGTARPSPATRPVH